MIPPIIWHDEDSCAVHFPNDQNFCLVVTGED